jgi:hypothetical protein
MRSKSNLTKHLQLRFLGSVLEFLARSGVSESSIRDSFDKGLVRSRSFRSAQVSTESDGKYQKSGDVSAHLLRLWHRDARYITRSDSAPRPLLLIKGKNSLRSLIRTLDPSADALEVLRNMKMVGLIRKTKGGRYLPTTNATVIPGLHPWATEHAARSVIRLVSTVFRNANREGNDPALLERYSYVPDLSPEEGRNFADFSRSQGQAYLDTLDDWLEQRRIRETALARRSRGRGIAAGVHVITYLGDGTQVQHRPKRERSTPKSRAPSTKTKRTSTPSPSTPA